MKIYQLTVDSGGTNPAIRTLFYRLVRLLGLSIQPIFVFDGPNKPAFKRNKRSGRGDGVASAMAKRLIRLFGFPVHQAPGEAEAECAFLQQLGIVDAVLSEDVDTIMFGCSRTFRNWTAEGPRGSKAPTHVTVYDRETPSFAAAGLGREEMVLVALMSGGDYIPEGVPGCGVKLACEVARAGFGKTLCRLKASDQTALAEWRSTLRHELHTNESGLFRTRHKALRLPDDFPNMEVLRHYTHPVVSEVPALQNLKSSAIWKSSIDLVSLRMFVDETFDWTYRLGAIKLIRVLSPSLLAQQLLERHLNPPAIDGLHLIEEQESALIRAITGRRTHFSVDGTPELRVSHLPAKIVPLDLSQEVEETILAGRQGLALNSDDEQEATIAALEDPEVGNSQATKQFNPDKPLSIWLPESLLKLGVPLSVQDWEEKQRAKTASTRPKDGLGKSKGFEDVSRNQGSLDKWVRTTKLAASKPRTTHQAIEPSQSCRGELSQPLPQPQSAQAASLQSPARVIQGSAVSRQPRRPRATVPRSKQPSQSTGKAVTAKPTRPESPKAASGSHCTPRIIKSARPAEAIVISSSPECGSPFRASSPLKEREDHALGPWAESVVIERPCTPTKKSPTVYPNDDPRSEDGGSPSKKSRRTGNGNLKQTSMASFIRQTPTKALDETRRVGMKSCPRDSNSLTSSPLSTPSTTRSVTAVLARHALVTPLPKSDRRASRALDSSPTSQCKRWQEDVFMESQAVPTGKTKVLMPRESACGFFEEVEISREEAEQMTQVETREGLVQGRTHTRKLKAWRRSRVSIIDLTGDE